MNLLKRCTTPPSVEEVDIFPVNFLISPVACKLGQGRNYVETPKSS